MNGKDILDIAEFAKRMPVYPDERFPPSLYYRFLEALAQRKQPNLSVELGLCGGGASLHMAIGWPFGKVIGVDIRLEYPDNISFILEHYPNFEFWQMDSVESASDIVDDVDILFIDTVHTYEQTMAEFGAYWPRMAKDSIVVLDDLFREGMDRVWDELPGLEKIRLDKLHVGGGPTDGGFGVILL